MKRITFLLVTLFCSLVTFAATSGKCGDNLTWKYDNRIKTLTISGTGRMYDYLKDNETNPKQEYTPWKEYAEEIETLILEEGVTTIGSGAFCRCSTLHTIKFPNSLQKISSYAFHYACVRGRDKLDINIPNSVLCIGKSAFYACSNCQSITIPANVRDIGELAFSSCHWLTSINIASENPNYCSVDGVMFSKDMTTLIQYPNNREGVEYIVPEEIEEIGSWAFGGAHKLISVLLPSTLKRVGLMSFSNCKNLESITIPDSVKVIGFHAFWYCENLLKVELPASLTSVGRDAFYGCNSLKEVIYPKWVDLSHSGIHSSAKLIAYASSQTPHKSSDVQPKRLPLLALVDGSLKFSDENGNNRIDADEKCTVKFRVANNGKGAATNCEARVKLSGASNGITVNKVQLPMIAAGNSYEVSIPINTSVNTLDGQVSLSIEVYEPQGWGIPPFTMTVATKAYDPPYLQVVDYNIASTSGKIRKMEPFTLSFNLQNTKYGNAENVKVSVKLPANVFVMDGSAELSYPLIKSGEVKSVKITLAANNNYSTTNIPIVIDVKEKHGKFAENKQLDIALNQTTSSSVNIAAKEEAEQERKEIQLAMMSSDVDRNIPVTKAKNPNTFVLIIANEHYQQVASVPFALNDGNIFREYCIKTLGIGEKHIHYVADATGNQIKSHINWLANITETWDDAQVIVYYAGHGIPDEASKSAYLLPVDGSGTDVTTGYKLDDLYATLGNMPASQITVFMDACFSGSKREQGMLASARGVALKAKSGVPQGKMVVFSAAQGDETAYPNREQQHGLFTYYLLKKLQETQGDIALKDLGDYVTKQVSQQSLLLNSKKQTPSVIPSAEVGTDWENWKLK